MSDIAIRVENLSKLYRIGAKQERYKTLRDTLVSTFKNPINSFIPNKPEKRDRPDRLEEPDHIWALKDVSFEIKRGEVTVARHQANRIEWTRKR